MSGLRSHLRAAAAALAVAWCGMSGAAHAAGSPFLEASDPAEAMRSPAYRYANMTNEEAFAELDRRHILYVREKPTFGVRAPIRLTGRLHGVHVHSSLPPEQRPSTPFEILDARLALAIDDFCAILERHDVDELVHYTMYRPNVPPPGAAPATGSAAVAGKDGPKSAPARKAGGAKRRVEPKGSTPALGKGQKPGGKTTAGTRSRARQKSGADDVWDPLEPKEGFGEEALVALDDDALGALIADALAHEHGHELGPHHGHDHGAIEDGVDDLAKAATGGRRAPGKAGGATPAASKPTAVPRTARRTTSALRRPPPRDAEAERSTHRNWAPPGTRHPAGLAIDLGGIRKRDGRWLSVAGHFDGKIGQRTCGVGAPVPVSAEARELRAIVCEARSAGVFTYALTPNFDADHVDHVHFEIKPGVTWFLFH